jgi:hypothetical protein
MSAQSLVAVYPTITAAEQALRLLTRAKSPVDEISLVANNISATELKETEPGQVKHLAKVGVRVAMAAAVVSFPGVMAGSLAAGALTGVGGAIVGSVLGDVVKSLGARGSVAGRLLGYEETVKGGNFVLMAHGSSAEIDQAREILLKTNPTELTLHAEENDQESQAQLEHPEEEGRLSSSGQVDVMSEPPGERRLHSSIENEPRSNSDANGTNRFCGPPSSEKAPNPNDASSSERNHVDRAEQMVDRTSENAAAIMSACGRWLGYSLSWFKEGAKDIWAEAQTIRRGGKL